MWRNFNRSQKWVGPALDVSLGTIFSLQWMFNEAGRLDQWYSFAPLILLGGLIATSRKLPNYSLLLLVAFGATQLIPELRITNIWAAIISFIYLSFWLGVRSSRPILTTALLGLTLVNISMQHIFSSLTTFGIIDEQNTEFFILQILTPVSAFFIGMLTRYLFETVHLRNEYRRLEIEIASDRADLFIHQDRLQVADELHDVLAQTLAAISMQAEGARANDSKEILSKSMEQIGQISRAGLSELRQLLESLKDNNTTIRPKSIGDIPELLSYTRITGLRVTLDEKGQRRKIVPLLDHLAFRIVQESLTNALKYSDLKQTVKVEIIWGTSNFEICIRSNGLSKRFAQVSSGYGIESLRRRVQESGGTLVTGFENDYSQKTFVTHSTLPIVRA